MLLELCKRLSRIEDLSLEVKYDGSRIQLQVKNDEIGSLYSYSCYDVKEAYDKVNEFIECLVDSSKFDKLRSDILEVALEV